MTINNPVDFKNRMINYYRFSEAIADKLTELELESGYGNLSYKAMKKIVPFLEQGEIYSEACRSAGYDHSQPNKNKSNKQMLDYPPDTRNPVVNKALWEVRKLLNALIAKYGKPSIIRIEMSRDMKLSKKQRDDKNNDMRKREKENDRINKILEEFGIQHPTRDDRIKYALWEECKQTCPYSGVPVSMRMLFSGEVDVEHIIPYSRCLDDSQMNKTICLAKENRDVKRNQTPYEAYSGNIDKYNEILHRVEKSSMHENKRRKFKQKTIKDDFVSRQLNDTRYISVAVKDYLQTLGVTVDVTKGQATADLRRLWRLNEILIPSLDGKKNREDHRHHAIDAVVIALTNRGLFQKISRLSSQSPLGLSISERGFTLDPPWQTFREDVSKSMWNIVVVHSVNHKITGALHEKTAYGKAEDEDKKGYLKLVYRKRIESFDKLKQLDDVRDPAIRQLMLQRLEECNYDFKTAFKNKDKPLMHKDGKTPIETVRVLTTAKASSLLAISDHTLKPYKFFMMGNNHHVEIIEHRKTGKREGIIVTALEAAKRARRDKVPVVQTDHGPDYRFIAALHINDMVEVEENGEKRIYRVQKMSVGEISLRLHTAATLEHKEELLRRSANTLKFRLLKVDQLGNISYAERETE